MKILTIVGARPQFIKAAMVSKAIVEHNANKHGTEHHIHECIVHTGQHYDKNMSQVFFDELGIPKPVHNLHVGSGRHGETTGKMLQGIEKVLLQEAPDQVMVYGDTNSTLAGALAAVKLHIPVIHVEAGLRSFNRQMPEEINRILTDHASDLLFCPTAKAVSNLAGEGIVNGVHHVGDVMFDASLVFGRIAEKGSGILEDLCLSPKEFCLATVHRAENTDDEQKLVNILEALMEIGQMIRPVVLPLHPRTKSVLERIRFRLPQLNQNSELYLTPPVSFIDMVMLEKNAKIILTDSGGIQKEAYFHQVPCITFRNETEWGETIEAGWNQLAGTEKKSITRAARNTGTGRSINEYGNGNAAKKIIQYVQKHFQAD